MKYLSIAQTKGTIFSVLTVLSRFLPEKLRLMN